LSRWQIGILSFYLVAAALIVKGGYNYRYQLTLVPLTILIIFDFLTKEIKGPEVGRYKKEIYGAMILLILINVLVSYEKLHAESAKYIPKSTTSNEQEKNKQYFEEMADYINALPKKDDEKFIINNLPEFYYYTDKFGYYCWFGDDICYNLTNFKIFASSEDSNVTDFLKNTLKAKYILSTGKNDEYNVRAKQYLDNNTNVIFQSQDYILYEIK
jgi:hypothetical protein